MAATIGTTEASVMLADVWGAKTVAARNETFYAANRVERWDEDVAGYGDVIHRPRISQMNSSPVGADGTVTFLAPTEAEVTITINVEEAVAFRVTDRVMEQSKYNLPDEYKKQAGAGLARAIETDIFELYSGLSTNVLATQPDFDEDYVLRAVQKLDENLAPEDNRFGFVRPSQKKALLLVDKFVSNQFRSGAGIQITKGRLTLDIHGIEWNVSTLVVRTGGVSYNMCWHKAAFALAVQTKVKFEELARDGARRAWMARELYGFGEVRDAEAVQMPTSN